MIFFLPEGAEVFDRVLKVHSTSAANHTCSAFVPLRRRIISDLFRERGIFHISEISILYCITA